MSIPVKWIILIEHVHPLPKHHAAQGFTIVASCLCLQGACACRSVITQSQADTDRAGGWLNILCGYRAADNQITACGWREACWKWLQLSSISCLLCRNHFHCLWLYCVGEKKRHGTMKQASRTILFSWDMYGIKLQLRAQKKIHVRSSLFPLPPPPRCTPWH